VVEPFCPSSGGGHAAPDHPDEGFRLWRSYLDEMYFKLNGAMVYLLRAIDRGGEILDSFMTRKRDICSIGLKKAPKRHVTAETIVRTGCARTVRRFAKSQCRQR
jgi:transposase-like protein